MWIVNRYWTYINHLFRFLFFTSFRISISLILLLFSVFVHVDSLFWFFASSSYVIVVMVVAVFHRLNANAICIKLLYYVLCTKQNRIFNWRKTKHTTLFKFFALSLCHSSACLCFHSFFSVFTNIFF